MKALMKPLSVILLLATVFTTSCKKNEESFDLKADLVTKSYTTVPSAGLPAQNSWSASKERVLISEMDRQSGNITKSSEINNDFNNTVDLLDVSPVNLRLKLNGKTQICPWEAINNDQIFVDSIQFLTSVISPVYFNVEISKTTVSSISEAEAFIGNPIKVSTEGEILLAALKTIDLEKLSLKSDYTYISSDLQTEFRQSRELIFYRFSTSSFPSIPIEKIK